MNEIGNSHIDIKKKFPLFLPVATTLFLVLALWAVWQELNHITKINRISSNGIAAKAEISDKDFKYGRYFDTYLIFYEFFPKAAQSQNKTKSFSTVKENVYNAAQINDIITITYNRDNPAETSYGDITNTNISDFLISNFVYYSVLVLAFLSSVLILLLYLIDNIRKT